MAIDAVADAAIFSGPRLKSRQEARIAESLAAEEAAGRLLALRGRTVALIVIGVFLSFSRLFPTCSSTSCFSLSSSSPATGDTPWSASASSAGGSPTRRSRSIPRSLPSR